MSTADGRPETRLLGGGQRATHTGRKSRPERAGAPGWTVHLPQQRDLDAAPPASRNMPSPVQASGSRGKVISLPPPARSCVGGWGGGRGCPGCAQGTQDAAGDEARSAAARPVPPPTARPGARVGHAHSQGTRLARSTLGRLLPLRADKVSRPLEPKSCGETCGAGPGQGPEGGSFGLQL